MKALIQTKEDLKKSAVLSALSALFLLILLNLYCPDRNLLFQNSDFEMGDRTNWDAQGWVGGERAFDNQPTFGDNPWHRDAGASHYVGNYWVGTFEDRHTPDAPSGRVQGNKPIGKLISHPFVIRRDRISFQFGGGPDSEDIRVELLVDGKVVRVESKKGILFSGERMKRIMWPTPCGVAWPQVSQRQMRFAPHSIAVR